jgi:methionyl aminopeptidase
VPVGPRLGEARELLRVTEESLYKAIEWSSRARACRTSATPCKKHVEAFGFSVVREFVGHGIGQKMHEEPQVPNTASRAWSAALGGHGPRDSSRW